jgi:hypothetical protein
MQPSSTKPKAQRVFFQTAKNSPVLIGEVAQFDESEDDVDEGCIPIRYRGRIMSVPGHVVRPVG